MTDRIPAEVFPPGGILREELEARGWTQSEFAEIIGRPTRVVNEIVAGKRGITPETAQEIAAALGTSPHFWLNLEASYKLSRAEPAPRRIPRAAKLRSRFPVREMINRGWIESSENHDVLESRVLKYFGLEAIDSHLSFSHSARRNEENEISPTQLAWIFRVRQLANTLDITSYSEQGLRSALGDLESLMVDPEEARHVPRILTEAGVRFLVVEPIPRSKIEGVCFWINNNRSPVISLSMRFDRIDNFWFNLRHELEHVLNGNGKSMPVIDEPQHMEGSPDQSEEERLANEAAAEFCVPRSEMDGFIGRLDPMYPTKRLIGFSRIVRRHPGIVAGQLQKKTGRWGLFRSFQAKIRHIVTDSTLTDGYGYSAPAEI